MRRLILDEVNVKELKFVEGQMLEKKVKCNFRVMGKKFGKLMKAVAGAVDALTQAEIASLETEGTLALTVEGESITVERADVEIVSEDIPGWVVANEGALTVALDIEVTDDLRREGLAREMVKRIQAYRKDNGFEITDHINIVMQAGDAAMCEAVEAFREYICTQVLADSFTFAAEVADAAAFDFDGNIINVNISKA